MLSINPINASQHYNQKSNVQTSFKGVVIRDVNGVKKELSNFQFFLYRIFSNKSKSKLHDMRITSFLRDLQRKLSITGNNDKRIDIYNQAKEITDKQIDKILEKRKYSGLTDTSKKQLKDILGKDLSLSLQSSDEIIYDSKVLEKCIDVMSRVITN